jgi:hypothetical protein
MTQECKPCSENPEVHEWSKLPVYWLSAGMHEFIFWLEVDATDPIIVVEIDKFL